MKAFNHALFAALLLCSFLAKAADTEPDKKIGINCPGKDCPGAKLPTEVGGKKAKKAAKKPAKKEAKKGSEKAEKPSK